MVALATASASLFATVSAAPHAAAASTSNGPWTLSTTDPDRNYSPTFIGNGYFAARVPAEGTGFSASPIVTRSTLAGFYANVQQSQYSEQRAVLPTWTTLGVNSGTDSFGNLPVCVFNEVCEAAVGALSGGAAVGSDHGGSTDGVFVDGIATGATVTVPVTQSTAGAASVQIRYANGYSTGKTVSYSVNGGAPQQVTLASTGNWDTWSTVTVPASMQAGTNTVTITVAASDSGQVNLDTVAAYPATGSAPSVVAQRQQGTMSGYTQKLDMSTGTLTTSFTWTAPSGRTTDFTYTANADRSDGHVGMVTMAFTPHWSGTAAVVDALDARSLQDASAGAPSVNGANGTLTETIAAKGSGVSAALASVLRVGGTGTTGTALADGATAAQSAPLNVTSGTTYTATKYVGIAASDDTDRSVSATTPQQYALNEATAAANLGAAAVKARNNAAWSKLWDADISVPGNDTLTGQIRANMFYLLESLRAGVEWGTSPTGLSSSGRSEYNGHVFWDMETWMYPALLAQHPDIAQSANAYRQRLLPQAQKNTATCAPAGQTISGARFPLESGLTGTDSYFNGRGACTEIHITADIAQAQWRYYQATGDTTWLKNNAWPVLQGAARYYASRAVADPNKAGAYQILDVMPPDESEDHVNNSAYTNSAAQGALKIAIQAARITGNTADSNWSTVADGLGLDTPFDSVDQHYLEFDGYAGQRVNQADVTMLQYPWNVPMSPTVARNDLDYYGGARMWTGGPAMTDSVAAIDAAALAGSRCDAYTYLEKSVNPYLYAPFDQVSETINRGAFTFTTSSGGFLQEFLYGFTGLRWDAGAVELDPNLPPQLPGLDLTGLKWHGSTFNLSITPSNTTITVTGGPAMPVKVAGGTAQTVSSGSSLTVPTRRPDRGADAAACKPATASSADPHFPAEAAVDGSPATAWHATGGGANLTVDLGATKPLSQVQVQSDGDTTGYSIQGSNDKATWTTLASQGATTSTATTVSFPAASYRYLRYQADTNATAQVTSLTVSSPITGYVGLCLDVRGANSVDGTPVQVYTCNSTGAQQWTGADGNVQALGKCLDVQGARTGNGTAVQLYACNGSGAQQWQVRPDGSLFNPPSGRCLDDAAFGGPGTQLIIWDCTGGANQKWTLS